MRIFKKIGKRFTKFVDFLCDTFLEYDEPLKTCLKKVRENDVIVTRLYSLEDFDEVKAGTLGAIIIDSEIDHHGTVWADKDSIIKNSELLKSAKIYNSSITNSTITDITVIKDSVVSDCSCIGGSVELVDCTITTTYMS